MAYRKKKLSRYDYKLLSRAKKDRLKRTILRTIRNTMIGARGSDQSKATFGATYDDATAPQLRNRAKFMFRGKGAYSVNKFIRDVGNLGEGIKKTYNAWVPKSLRDQVIGIASNKLGGMGMYTGRGAYAANELVAGGVPSMGVIGAGDETEAICISNREYVTDVYGSPNSSFHNQSITINPGLQQNFPWLSQIAANYDEYEFNKLIFMYRSTIDIGNTNTAGQTGTMIMVCDYNVSHQPFTSKDTMMQYHGAVSGKATDDMVCGIECDPAKTNKLAQFVRVNPVPVGEDPKTYDLGLFQFALNNIPAAMYNLQLGELWVEYEVILRKPKLGVSRGILQQKDIFVSGGNSTYTANVQTPSPTNPMGTQTWLCEAASNSLGGELLTGFVPYKLRYTFPAAYSGDVMFRMNIAGRGTQISQSGDATYVISGNMRPIADQYGAYPGEDVPIAEFISTRGASASPMKFEIWVRLRVSAATGGIDNYIELDFSTVTLSGATTWRQASVVVEEINPSFNRSALDDDIVFKLQRTGTEIVTLPAQP